MLFLHDFIEVGTVPHKFDQLIDCPICSTTHHTSPGRVPIMQFSAKCVFPSV